MQYKEFVKQEMAKMKSSKLSQPEKMKKIGQMWKSHSLKGGVIEEQQQEPEEESTMSKGLQLGKPFIDYNTMVQNGFPPYLAQHPNIYSGNLNNVLLFNNVPEFLDSAFYKKYQDRITYKKPIRGFSGAYQEYDVPAKKYRIVFHANSFTDKSVWYIDPKDADEWLQVMNDAKDSYLLTPVEFISALKIKNLREQAAKQAERDINLWNQANEEGFKTGFGQGKEEGYQEGYQQGKSDSSSSSSWLDTALGIGKAALSFI